MSASEGMLSGMDGLLRAALDIHLGPNESWLSHNTGSVLVAAAAFFAAALAAYVATRNHRQQLEHDRFLQNKEQTRESMEKAVAAANDAIVSVHTYLNTARKEIEKENGAPSREGVEGKLYTLETSNALLHLRFGEDHTVIKKHTAISTTLRDLLKTVDLSANDLAKFDEKVPAGRSAVGTAFSEFRQACHSWLDEPMPQLRRHEDPQTEREPVRHF